MNKIKKLYNYNIIKLHVYKCMEKSFTCDKCKFVCYKVSDWTRHIHTKKHLQFTEYIHQCSCGKSYKHLSSIYKHKKTCVSNTSEKTSSSEMVTYQHGSSNQVTTHSHSQPISNEMILQLIQKNQELQTLLIEQSNKIVEISSHVKIVNTNNHYTTNNHFNLNIFLNEQCKDAISMVEFIDSLQVNTNNVEYTGRNGYVNGITKIFMDGLRQLDVYKRPIHCTDLKRETLYIKEVNTWEKDTQEKTIMKKALGAVVRKNLQQIRRWQEENPKCEIPESKEYMLHLDIMRQSIGGGIRHGDKNNLKIIKNIAKEVMITPTKKEMMKQLQSSSTNEIPNIIPNAIPNAIPNPNPFIKMIL